MVSLSELNEMFPLNSTVLIDRTAIPIAEAEAIRVCLENARNVQILYPKNLKYNESSLDVFITTDIVKKQVSSRKRRRGAQLAAVTDTDQTRNALKGKNIKPKKELLIENIQEALEEFYSFNGGKKSKKNKREYKQPGLCKGIDCNMYITDMHELYQIKPHVIKKLPKLLNQDLLKQMCERDHGHRGSPFREYVPKDRKGIKESKRRRGIWCDLCKRRVQGDFEHHEKGQNHQDQYRAEDIINPSIPNDRPGFQSFDQTLERVNSTWNQKLKETKETIQREQARGEEYELQETLLTEDPELIIEMMLGKLSIAEANRIEEERRSLERDDGKDIEAEAEKKVESIGDAEFRDYSNSVGS